MGEDSEAIKVGSVAFREDLSEIIHETEGSEVVSIRGLVQDSEDPDALLATRYVRNVETGESSTEHGKVRGYAREATHYIWEHKKPISAAASLAVSVTLGTLWVRHKKKS